MTRRSNDYLQERLVLPYEHAAVTADTTIKLWSPDRRFRIDRVWYNNPTGLAADGTNFFNLKILNDAAVAANWSTETGEEGGLTANTPVEFTVSTSNVVEAGDVISLFLDEDATASLPAGRLVIEGRYL